MALAGGIMPQLERTAFEGAELARVHSSVAVAREVRLRVFETDDSLFRRFIAATYRSHVYKWEAVHPTGSFPVLEEEWFRYAMTALRARLARVNDERFVIRSDAEWQIPSMIAAVLNGVGRVTIDSPAMQYTPVWNSEYDVWLLNLSQWADITARMRAIAADREYTKFVFVRNLTGDRSGDQMIMDLIPVRDDEGRIVQLRSMQPVDGVAAFVYLAMGFLPEEYAVFDLNVHPRALPPKYLETAVVEYGADELGLRSA
jgi:hypothetical protein